jgi:hypothetical protein
MLSGVVQVVVAGGSLTLIGDGSNNSVQIQQLSHAVAPTAGSFQILGLNQTKIWDGSGSPNDAPLQMNVFSITGDITVGLGTGQDSFTFLQTQDSSPVNSIIIGNLNIVNDSGTKTIDLKGVQLYQNLAVSTVAGASVSDVLTIEGGSVIQGATSIHNAVTGDNTTTIDSSDLQGSLTITNGNGTNNITVTHSTIGTAAGGATNIVNGNGGSKTMFNAATGQSSILYGFLTITNGTATKNEVDFTNTQVRGFVTIINGDSTTLTNIQSSTLGTDVAVAAPLTINNGAGYDQTNITSTSDIPWGATINDGVAGQFYGSQTTIANSKIGDNSVIPAGLTIHNDSFDNVIKITASSVSTAAAFTNAGGNNVITLGAPNVNNLGDTTFGLLDITCGAGDDTVTLQNVTVYVTTDVDLGAGVDTLVLPNVKFNGATVLDGGAGINDTYKSTTVLRPVGYTFNILDFEN